MFHVGQMVVCLGMRSKPQPGERYPQKGNVYTIREFHFAPSGLGLRFEEVVNSPRQHSDEFGESSFAIDRFRPVAKTDISIFQSMLAPKQKELVHE